MSSGDRASINWVQVIGTALAAMSSAVLLSTLGVTGTVIGAAVGSIVASVGGAAYTRGIAASQQQVTAQAAALRRAAKTRGQGPDGTAVMEAVETDETDAAQGTESDGIEDPEGAEAAEGGDALYHVEPGKPLPWKRIAVVAAVLFVAVMVTITAVELATGRSVSSITGGSEDDGGTTLFDPGRGKDDTSSPAPSDGSTGTATPSEDAEDTSTPSDGSSPTGTPTLPTETASPTGTPSDAPTESDADVN